MSKIDTVPLASFAESTHVSTWSDLGRESDEEGSLLRGFLWATGAGLFFWIVLARLLLG